LRTSEAFVRLKEPVMKDMLLVIPGLVPGIPVFGAEALKTWVAGSDPRIKSGTAMTGWVPVLS